MEMFALIDLFQNGSVRLYDDLRNAQIAMKTEFAQTQFEMMKKGATFGKSRCYSLEDRSAQLFADDCLWGHTWLISKVEFPDELRRKRKLDLYAIVNAFKNDEIIICNGKENAQAQLEKIFNEKKAEMVEKLDSGEEIEEELKEGSATLRVKASLNFNMLTIMKAERIRR